MVIIMFKFTSECRLGVEAIDKEHEHLFSIINEAITIIYYDYGEDQYFKIKHLLNELEHYADSHFAHEEAYMEKIRDPELILQRSQHRVFQQRLYEFTFRNIHDEAPQREALKELLAFLSLWLYRHILSSDTMIGKLPPIEEWMLKENPCEFLEEYMTGINLIDREHEVLFETIERAHTRLGTWREGDPYDDIINILDELKADTIHHFADEEEYMQHIGFEGYGAQKHAHEAFVYQMDNVDFGDIEENPKLYMQSLFAFLMGWMINHIVNMDKKIPAM